MLNIPRISSVLATVALESFFFGVYLVVCATAVFLLLKRRAESKSANRQIVVLFGTTALFLVVTGHWMTTIYRFFFAFVTFPVEGQDPMVFYADWAQPTEVLQTAFLMAALTIPDTLMVHRLWIIWGYNKKVVIFPLCTLVGLIISSVGVTYEFSQYSAGNIDWALVADHWIIVDCVFTLCTNIYCTAFMAYRIWRTDKLIRPLGGPTIMYVLRVMVESAALAAAWGIFFIIAYGAQSNLRFLVDITPSVVGALTMLVYMRTGMGWNRAPDGPAVRPIPVSFRHSTEEKTDTAEFKLDSAV
ncbi:hypothetical protein C8F04DRAFT_744153 [Mycena alexandri]|uniref:Uncharacterized protein n=1 Tax=Mycena alexandri TaxID=1745969 RepID=A0AAD6SM77_9AGAR|nr:hypothetical protein C8F04DRAFT_744153 [Mycena alexandri]